MNQPGKASAKEPCFKTHYLLKTNKKKVQPVPSQDKKPMVGKRERQKSTRLITARAKGEILGGVWHHAAGGGKMAIRLCEKKRDSAKRKEILRCTRARNRFVTCPATSEGSRKIEGRKKGIACQRGLSRTADWPSSSSRGRVKKKQMGGMKTSKKGNRIKMQEGFKIRNYSGARGGGKAARGNRPENCN